eukprot:6196564-Pleurochrysis_carterae.AAC.7
MIATLLDPQPPTGLHLCSSQSDVGGCARDRRDRRIQHGRPSLSIPPSKSCPTAHTSTTITAFSSISTASP